MFRSMFDAIITAARSFFGNWKTMAAFVALFTALVIAVYLFFTTPEAKTWQVALTFLLTLAIPVLFFMLQTLGVEYVNREHKLSEMLARTGKEFWKLLIISLPVIALTWLVVWGINKFDVSLTAGIRDAANSAGTAVAEKAGEERIKTLATTITIVNALILYFIVPLFSIHLWIATLQAGFKQAIVGLLRIIVRAFAPRSVLTYLLGLIIFGVLPYYIITTRTPIKSPWLDLTMLGLRIALALLVIMIGWIITVGALALMTPPQPLSTNAETELSPLSSEAAA